ncbi:sensor histidine kinase [Saccharibacillus brassicae]|uniref:histidine kinase n=1 Tax=Saccharibacillus brassicae TaxID=2583377 RepID=A0A4Y6UZ22_SACBS|nr:histidine kinase [Saccharibacillus brassicae]QDH22999.1 HAMP domain-containing protein [Saccharibacillus brassicae]
MKFKKIRTKIVTAMLLTTLFPLVLTSSIILYQVSQSTRQDYTIAQTRIEQDLKFQIRQYLDDLGESAYPIYYDYELLRNLFRNVNERSGKIADYQTRQRMKQFFLNTYGRFESSDVKGMYVIDLEGNPYSVFSPNYYLSLNRTYTKSVLRDFTFPYENPAFAIDDRSLYDEPVVRYLYPLKMLGTPFAVLVIDLRQQSFESLLERYNTFEQGRIVMVNRDNRIIYHSDHALIGRMYEKDRDRRTQIVQTRLDGGGETLIYEFRVSSQLIFYRDFAVGIIIFSLLISALLSFGLSYNLTLPVLKLHAKMRALRDGNYEARVEITTSDEIAFLGMRFNEMAHRIQWHIDHELNLRLQTQEAQIKALQSQISPHFLFNTLQLISNIASVNRVPEMRSICLALSHMYRYNMEIRKEWVQVKDEISHVRNYLLIINKRLPEGIHIRISASPEVRELKMPKLMLQPIVENAVEHGLIPLMQGQKKMRISVCVDVPGERLIVRLADNGVGMPASELERLRTALDDPDVFPGSPSASIGMPNIQKRIKLICGEDYGIKMLSRPGQGTLIVLHLPLKEVHSA